MGSGTDSKTKVAIESHKHPRRKKVLALEGIEVKRKKTRESSISKTGKKIHSSQETRQKHPASREVCDRGEETDKVVQYRRESLGTGWES